MSRIWLVTGAARGIGAEIVKAAVAAGDRVVATGRDREQIERNFADHGDRVLALALDVTSEAQALAAVEAAVDRFGGIDVLVNNAGYGLLGAFEESTVEEIERQFATNVFGLMHVTRAVLPVMRRRHSGRIFNLSSVGGVIGYPAASLYCSTKFAVEGFSESLVPELAPFGIRLTIVEPGFFRTDFLDGSSIRYGSKVIADYAASSQATRAGYDERNHRQAGDPAKLAAALVMLAGEAEPPLRYAAGSDSAGWILEKTVAMGRELERWWELSVSTDYVAGQGLKAAV
jgi:NAD(P)-dependent dehydrogenase (short-subunit alcohol dehydrogenase family)